MKETELIQAVSGIATLFKEHTFWSVVTIWILVSITFLIFKSLYKGIMKVSGKDVDFEKKLKNTVDTTRKDRIRRVLRRDLDLAIKYPSKEKKGVYVTYYPDMEITKDHIKLIVNHRISGKSVNTGVQNYRIEKKYLESISDKLINSLSKEGLIFSECFSPMSENGQVRAMIADEFDNLRKLCQLAKAPTIKNNGVTSAYMGGKLVVSKAEYERLLKLAEENKESRQGEKALSLLRSGRYFEKQKVLFEPQKDGVTYLFIFKTKAIEKRERERDVLRRAGLTKSYRDEYGVQHNLYPQIIQSDDSLDIIINPNGVILTKDQVEKAFPVFETFFTYEDEGIRKFVKCLKVDLLEDGSFLVKVAKKRPDYIFEYGSPAAESPELINMVIDRCVELTKEKGTEYVPIAEMIDSSPMESEDWKKFLYKGYLLIPLNDIVHLMVAGATRSGKSETVKQMSYMFARVCREYHGSDFYFADGLGNADWRLFCRYFSEYDLGVLDSSYEDKEIPLANIILKVRKLQKERAALFAETGAKDIDEYRAKGNSLSRVFLVIDEFNSFVAEGVMGSHEDNSTLMGAIASLAREARKYGIMLILSSQEAKADVYPKPLANNIPTRLIHKVKENSANYLGCPRATNISGKGKFYISMDGYENPETNDPYIMCIPPYLGSTSQVEKLIETHFEATESVEFNKLIEYSKSSKLKLSPEEDLWIRFQKYFFAQESWKMEEQFISNKRIADISISSIFSKEINGTNRKIGVGIIRNQKELSSSLFTDAFPEEKEPELNHNPDYYFMFLNFIPKDGFISNFESLKSNEIFKKTIFVSESSFSPKLSIAADNLENNIESNVFTYMIEKLIKEKEKVDKEERERISSLVSGVVDNSDFDYPEPDYYYDMNISMAEIISWKSKGLDNIKLGDYYEAFLRKLFRGLGFKATAVHDLLNDPNSKYNRPDGVKTGDKGLDIIIEKDGKRIGVQAKCWYSNLIEKDVLTYTQSGLTMYDCDEGMICGIRPKGGGPFGKSDGCFHPYVHSLQKDLLEKGVKIDLITKDELSELIDAYHKNIAAMAENNGKLELIKSSIEPAATLRKEMFELSVVDNIALHKAVCEEMARTNDLDMSFKSVPEYEDVIEISDSTGFKRVLFHKVEGKVFSIDHSSSIIQKALSKNCQMVWIMDFVLEQDETEDKFRNSNLTLLSFNQTLSYIERLRDGGIEPSLEEEEIIEPDNELPDIEEDIELDDLPPMPKIEDFREKAGISQAPEEKTSQKKRGRPKKKLSNLELATQRAKKKLGLSGKKGRLSKDLKKKLEIEIKREMEDIEDERRTT